MTSVGSLASQDEHSSLLVTGSCSAARRAGKRSNRQQSADGRYSLNVIFVGSAPRFPHAELLLKERGIACSTVSGAAAIPPDTSVIVLNAWRDLRSRVALFEQLRQAAPGVPVIELLGEDDLPASGELNVLRAPFSVEELIAALEATASSG